jgi:DNA-binding IclR family transcriptional regulator
MAHTYAELSKKTVDELREIAKGLEQEAVKGYTQMNKEHLLPAVCKALGINVHAHHTVVGIDKTAIKAKIKQLKAERDKALAARDHKQLRVVQRTIHSLKRKIRAATV